MRQKKNTFKKITQRYLMETSFSVFLLGSFIRVRLNLSLFDAPLNCIYSQLAASIAHTLWMCLSSFINYLAYDPITKLKAPQKEETKRGSSKIEQYNLNKQSHGADPNILHLNLVKKIQQPNHKLTNITQTYWNKNKNVFSVPSKCNIVVNVYCI